MSYTVELRTQFTFIVDDITLALVFEQCEATQIDIVGIQIQKLESSLNLIKTVVGSPETTESTPISSNTVQSICFGDILVEMDIKFHEGNVLQLFIEATNPGNLLFITTSLYCAGINIKGLYLGEPTENNVVSLFMEVPRRHINMSIDVLRRTDVLVPRVPLQAAAIAVC